MQGMRIKSHKNAFGTHNADFHKQGWNPNAPKAFWQGLHPVAPTTTTFTATSAPTSAKIAKPAKKAKKATAAKTRSRK